jgi:hypothetical protein
MMKIVSLLAVLVALGLGLLSLWRLVVWMPGETYAGPLEPLSAQERASALRLEADVRRLASDIGERSSANPRGLAAAAAHIERVFRELGFSVDAHEYVSGGATWRNVEATLGGTRAREEIVPSEPTTTR